MYSSNFDITKRDWANVPINKGRVDKQKPTVKAKWQKFQDMSEIEQDPFWIEMWSSCAKGRFPVGFKFNGNTLSYSSTRNKSSKVVMRNSSIEELCHLCKHMFQQCAWIFSEIDMQLIREREDLAHDDTIEEHDNWKAFDKTQQNSLIVQLVFELSQEVGFSNDEMNELWQTILTGINIGIITKKHINIVDSKISNIENLKWDDKREIFYIDIKDLKIKKSSNNSTTKKNKNLSIQTAWEKLNQNKKSTKKKTREYITQDLEDSVSASYNLE
jgi:hypothetical protein